MSETSPIQWTDGTVNPVVGCDGCELWQPMTKQFPRRSCYAGLLHERSGGRMVGYAARFEEPTRRPGEMEKAARASDLRGRRRADKPWLDGLPRLWFVSDMGDALSDRIDFPYLRAEVIDIAKSAAGRRHRWLWLTKKPLRMARFSSWLLERGVKWPSNVWPGTSITEPGYIKRTDDLRAVGDDATTRFVSVEPQHTFITLQGKLENIGWVVQGGESGPTRRTASLTLAEFGQREARPFDLSWARRVRDECDAAGAAYFLKQVGSQPVDDNMKVALRDRHGGDWHEWPSDLRVRQVPRS